MITKLPMVLITNGCGRSGKDTFATILGKHKKVCKISSIDFAKQIVSDFTNNKNPEKTEKYRKLLATIKHAFIEYDEYSVVNLLCQQIEDILQKQAELDYIIIDVREPEEIAKLKDKLRKTLGLTVQVLLFVRDEVQPENFSNSADAGVYDYAPYDLVVANNDTLEKFEDTIVFMLHDKII